MAERYKVQIGDEVIEFEGPDGLTDAQITNLADKVVKNAKPGEEYPHSVIDRPQTNDTDLPELVGGSVRNPEDSSVVGSFFRGLPKDALFNFNDEIAAFGNALIPGAAALDNATGMSANPQQAFYDNPEGFWAAVRNNMGGFKEQAEADEALHPVATGVGRVAGVLSTLPRAGVAAASRLPLAVREFAAARPIATTVALGGAGGAISGAGAGEEGTRAQSAAISGLTGAGLGPTAWAAGELAPVVARYAKVYLGNAGSATKEGLRQMVNALKRDGFDVSSDAGAAALTQELQQFRINGKPVSLADVGGASRARTGVALRTPSDLQQPSIDLLNQRAAGQNLRLANDVRANVAPRTDVHALDEALVDQRAQEAERLRQAALYEPAPAPVQTPVQAIEEGPNAGLRRILGFDDTPPVTIEAQLPTVAEGTIQPRIVDPMNPNYTPEQQQLAVELQNLARLPDAQRALKGAIGRARSEYEHAAATGADTSLVPNMTLGSDLDVRSFDYLKRYLDDEVNSLYRRGQGSTFSAAEAENVRNLRNSIRERLRKFVPEYGDYLDQYAGSSEMIDALREGGDFARLSPEQIVGEQSRRSDAAQELYRTGAARKMVDDIFDTKDGRNAANRILNSDMSRQQLEALGVSKPDAAALMRSVGQERQLNLLNQELSGSQTAQRLAAQSDAGADMIPTNVGNPYGFAGRFFKHIADNATLRRNEMVNDALLPRMTATDPAAIEATIAELQKEGKVLQAAKLRRDYVARRNALLGGAVVGSPVALQPLGDR